MNKESKAVVILIPIEHHIALDDFTFEVKMLLNDYQASIYLKPIREAEEAKRIQDIIKSSNMPELMDSNNIKAVFVPAQSQLAERIPESSPYEVYSYQYRGTPASITNKPASCDGTLVIDQYISDFFTNALIKRIDAHARTSKNYNIQHTYSIPMFTLDKYESDDLKDINLMYISESYMLTRSREERNRLNRILHSNPQITAYSYSSNYKPKAPNPNLTINIEEYKIPVIPEFKLIHKPGLKLNDCTDSTDLSSRPFIDANLRRQLVASPNYVITDPSDSVLIWAIKQQQAYKLIQKWIAAEGGNTGAYFWTQSFNQVIANINHCKDDYFKFNNPQFTVFCYRMIAEYCKLNTNIVKSNVSESGNYENQKTLILKNPNFEIIIFENIVNIKSYISVLGRATILSTEISLTEFIVDYIPFK